jgi:polyisoprenoid-binding protein YceI
MDMLAGIAALLVMLPGLAVAAPWVLDPDSRIVVDVEWQGSTVEVRFPAPTGEVDFDAEHPEAARAKISVSAREATTGLGPVDALVRGQEYLDAEQFPRITFGLDRLVQTSKQTAEITGDITLRGVTRPATFDATVIRYGPDPSDPQRFQAGIDLTGSIDRTEVGSTGGLPEVGAVLPVRIRLLMTSK